LVEILTSMIEPKLTFFEMQDEGAGSHATKANESCFCVAPKTFDPVDVSSTFVKFVLVVIDAQMLSIGNVDQAVIAAPAVRADDAFQLDSAPYNGL